MLLVYQFILNALNVEKLLGSVAGIIFVMIVYRKIIGMNRMSEDEETYDQNATKIAEDRAELGLDNPFSEFKPYVMTEGKLVTLEDVRQRIGKIYDEMERLPLPNKSDFKRMIEENHLHRSESEFKP